MGLTCTARVSCQAAEGGVYVPSQTQVAGVLSQAERDPDIPDDSGGSGGPRTAAVLL